MIKSEFDETGIYSSQNTKLDGYHGYHGYHGDLALWLPSIADICRPLRLYSETLQMHQVAQGVGHTHVLP